MNSKVALECYCREHVKGFRQFTGIQNKAFDEADFWSGERNVFITAPTASGKSLVAFAAMSQTRGGRALRTLYVVPFRSLATQKHEEICRYFAPIAQTGETDFDADKIYLSTSEHSVHDSDIQNGNAQVVVTIYEKLFLFMNHREDFLSQYDLVIMDEFGVVSDFERGLKIDFMYMACICRPELRLVTLSTPFYNWDTYLRCDVGCLYLRDDQFTHQLHHRDCFVKPWQQYIENAPPQWRIHHRDDLLSAICALEYQKGNSVLVFCHSRQRTRNLARYVYNFFCRNGVIQAGDRYTVETEFKEIYARIGVSTGDMYGLFEDDESDNGDLVANLKDAFLCGITFHNASQPHNLRAEIERQLLDTEEMKIVVATDTLAYGINSSVSTVIIDARQSADDAMMTQYEYLNYCGRAGRYREGYVYTLYRNEEDYLAMQKIINGEYQRLNSTFFHPNVANNRAFYILTLLKAQRRSEEEIYEYIRRLPIGEAESEAQIRQTVSECIEQLTERHLITRGSAFDFEEDLLKNTVLGDAVCGYIVNFSEFDLLRAYIDGYREDEPFRIFDYFLLLSSMDSFRHNLYFGVDTPEETGYIFSGVLALCDRGQMSEDTVGFVRTNCVVRKQPSGYRGWLREPNERGCTVGSLRQALVYTELMCGASIEELYHVGKVNIAIVQSLMSKYSYYTDLAVKLADHAGKLGLSQCLRCLALGLTLGGVPYALIGALSEDIRARLTAADSDVLKRMHTFFTLYNLQRRTEAQHRECKAIRTDLDALGGFYGDIWRTLLAKNKEQRII